MNSIHLEAPEYSPAQTATEPAAVVASPGKKRDPPELPAIQVLRGIAAALVVFHHAAGVIPTHTSSTSWLINARLPLLGAAGVDIFFVISGFLMFYTTTRKTGASDARTFLWRRTLRIYPLYWFWTSMLVLIALLKLFPMNHVHDLGFFVASYALVPVFNGFNFHPFLDQGWTLSFEMLFYCVFALGVWFSRLPTRLTFLTLSFTALFLLSPLFPVGSGARYLLSDTLIVEFLFGIVLAKAFLRMHDGIAPMPTWLAPALMGAGFLLLLSTTLLPMANESLIASRWRFAYWGIPSAFVAFGFASSNQQHSNPVLVFIGDASYSTYLTHNFILGAILRLAMKRVSASESLPADLELLVITVLTLLLTLPAYQWIERPLTSFFRLSSAPRRHRASFQPHAS